MADKMATFGQTERPKWMAKASEWTKRRKEKTTIFCGRFSIKLR